MMKEDKRNGFGVEKWPSGSQFEGLFKDDSADGHGVFKWYDGSKYIG
jgi:hypothetical protein